MTQYNYYEAVKSDVLDYISNEINYSDYEDLDELNEYLNETLWVEDSVTGNASGSYTFNAYEAEENLCHNMDLLQEALNEFGYGTEYLKNGPEACDVTIRCYLLSQAITESLEEIEDDFNAFKEETEDEE